MARDGVPPLQCGNGEGKRVGLDSACANDRLGIRSVVRHRHPLTPEQIAIGGALLPSWERPQFDYGVALRRLRKWTMAKGHQP